MLLLFHPGSGRDPIQGADMIRRGLVIAVLSAWLLPGQLAHARLLVAIDKSTQKMTISIDGQVKHVWPVSTGRYGSGTPNGSYRPQWLARRWFSRKYYGSPMPHAIFFHKGYAIHGTNYISRLGGPASHGCVRLHPRNAATLFALVQKAGSGATAIAVTGANPRPRRAAGPVRWQPKVKMLPRPGPPPIYRPFTPFERGRFLWENRT